MGLEYTYKETVMQTKLTLTIDESVVSEAKKYAKSHHQSVSKLVEEYLGGLTGLKTDDRSIKTIRSPLVDKISSLFQDDGRDYEDLLNEARTEKFS